MEDGNLQRMGIPVKRPTELEMQPFPGQQHPSTPSPYWPEVGRTRHICKQPYGPVHDARSTLEEINIPKPCPTFGVLQLAVRCFQRPTYGPSGSAARSLESCITRLTANMTCSGIGGACLSNPKIIESRHVLVHRCRFNRWTCMPGDTNLA